MAFSEYLKSKRLSVKIKIDVKTYIMTILVYSLAFVRQLSQRCYSLVVKLNTTLQCNWLYIPINFGYRISISISILELFFFQPKGSRHFTCCMSIGIGKGNGEYAPIDVDSSLL